MDRALRVPVTIPQFRCGGQRATPLERPQPVVTPERVRHFLPHTPRPSTEAEVRLRIAIEREVIFRLIFDGFVDADLIGGNIKVDAQGNSVGLFDYGQDSEP